MSVLSRCSSKTAIFSRFLKVAIAASNFMNQVYNGGYAPEFSVSVLKETIMVLFWDYVSEIRKWKAKLVGKYMQKWNMKSLLKCFFLPQKVSWLLHFASLQNCTISVNLVAEIHEKLWNQKALSTGEPCRFEYVTLL